MTPNIDHVDDSPARDSRNVLPIPCIRSAFSKGPRDSHGLRRTSLENTGERLEHQTFILDVLSRLEMIDTVLAATFLESSSPSFPHTLLQEPRVSVRAVSRFVVDSKVQAHVKEGALYC